MNIFPFSQTRHHTHLGCMSQPIHVLELILANGDSILASQVWFDGSDVEYRRVGELVKRDRIALAAIYSIKGVGY